VRLLLAALGTLLLAPPVTAQTKAPPSPAERDRALEAAAKEEAAGHPAEAARQLRAVADRFHSVKALLQLARLQKGQDDVAGALESLRQARVIAPSSEEVLSGYAEASLAAHSTMPAISALDSLTRICPTVGQYHYQMGMALMQEGDTAAAVESLKEAVRLEPGNALALIALGTALDRRELYADAKTHLLRALSLAPDNMEAVAALAAAEEGLGDRDAAETHAKRVLAQPSPPSLAHVVMGMVRMKQDRCDEARDALLAALAADPASAKAHYQLSLAYACLKDPATSRQHLEAYQEEVKDTEDRIRRVRTVTGFSEGATAP
jgi:tetratricopeptide (TPR) repeat protein